mmetsp:Transcript_13734/g.16345  ORF Transcript_13734/g.16345 Transcript_13734/m.16345 type:complete len:130 (-) Transcript_13734:420-809(-)|eukprot:CAMPEP_0114332552 /NCGR_PEP_ID=MMETSP0101-20121206/3161_1 /TAXON_ID=38822 ORGANISM="Pteridomonas danica, Strain PT" /NCGR_SAMPLE_ID=MMETSP0101 /ASSEMBLY_ACC=CAM_ASM_000211 /LENGTH=129 /DNA_ID=CAMNT_0001463269 /DNA_START=113 /DNA_END=502 /DNA_ORIENTATION=-
MGAGASACQSDSVYEQMMLKWDALLEQPQFSIDLKKPENFEELLKMEIPSSGSEREFSMALREYFHSIVDKEASCVIEIPLSDEQTTKKSSLQDAFKNRPITAKKRPNKKRQQMKAQALKQNDQIFSIA